jgi:glycosyltransferase involved in cell wall biosynthesis
MQKADFNYEILIGEDCSTDNTRKVVEQYVKNNPSRITLITSERNVGPIENAKRTLELSQRKYLAFCEGDDYWTDSYKLQKQIDFLEKNPGYGLVHTDVDHFYEEENRFEKDYNKSHGINFPSGNIFEECLKGDLFIKTASVVVRRDLFLKAANYDLFLSRNWMLQDLPTWLEIAANTKIKYMPETTAVYRLAGESASRTQNHFKKYNFHRDVYDIRFYYWNKYSGNEAIKKVLDKKYVATMMGDAFKMRNLNLAQKTFDYSRKSGISFNCFFKLRYIFLLLFDLKQKILK